MNRPDRGAALRGPFYCRKRSALNNFIIALNAVVPFTIYIMFGYIMRLTGTVEEPFLKKLNQMVFRVFFPFMTFYNFCKIDADFSLNGGYIVLIISSLLILVGVSFLIVPRLVPENARRGVTIQGIYRSNMILFAIPLTQSIFGSSADTLTAVVTTVTVPLYNVIAVIVLEYFRGSRPTPGELLKKIITNPLIRGAIAGLAVFLLGIKLPQSVLSPVSAISSMSTPLALFILGGTLHFSALRKNLGILTAILGTKLVLLPAAAAAVSAVLRLSPQEMFLYFCMFATPVAASSYPMAESMGGDGELAGQLVMVSTAASVFTLFGWIYLLKTLGML